MVRKIATLLLAFGAIISGCSTEETLCEAADCIAPVATLKIKIIDDATNENLLNKDGRFKLTDLDIRSSAYNKTIALKIDSTELNNKYVTILSSGTETFTIKYKNYPSDKLDIRSKLVRSACCKILEVQTISLNDKPLCTKCSAVEIIELRK